MEKRDEEKQAQLLSDTVLHISNSVIPQKVSSQYEELRNIVMEYIHAIMNLDNQNYHHRNTEKNLINVTRNGDVQNPKLEQYRGQALSQIQEIAKGLGDNIDSLELTNKLREVTSNFVEAQLMLHQNRGNEVGLRGEAMDSSISIGEIMNKINGLMGLMAKKLANINNLDNGNEKRIDHLVVDDDRHLRIIDSFDMSDKDKDSFKSFIKKFIEMQVRIYKEFESFAQIAVNQYTNRQLVDRDSLEFEKIGIVNELGNVKNSLVGAMWEFEDSSQSLNQTMDTINRWIGDEFATREEFEATGLERRDYSNFDEIKNRLQNCYLDNAMGNYIVSMQRGNGYKK